MLKSIKLRYLNKCSSVKSLQKEVTIGMQERLPWHFPSKMEEPQHCGSQHCKLQKGQPASLELNFKSKLRDIQTFERNGRGKAVYFIYRNILELSLVAYVTVIAQPWPFCTGNTGIPSVRAFWAQIRPCKHHSVSIMRRESNSRQCIANCGCPGRDIISNVQEMAYAVIRSRIRPCPGGIKAVAPLSRGVFLFLWLTGVLKYPTSQMSHRELSPGLYRTPL